MPDRIARRALRRPAPVVCATDTVAPAVRKMLDAGLLALPVAGPDGRYAGVFGVHELISAVFPHYLNELLTTGMISPALDDALERHPECARQLVGEHLDSEHPAVEDGCSDTHLAEVFLHHRVQIIPVLSGGRVEAVVSLAAFLRELGQQLLADPAWRPPARVSQVPGRGVEPRRFDRR